MLEELQSLNQATKKRLLIIATIIIMIIVVGIWISYLNSIVAGPAKQEAAAQANSTAAAAPAASGTAPVAMPVTVSAQASANGPSVWQNIKNWFGSIANIFRNPSQYNIQPNQ
jgi:zona occludens toxin (predicted ATPase)